MEDGSPTETAAPELLFVDVPGRAGKVMAGVGWTIMLIVPTFFAVLAVIGIGAAALNRSWFRQPAHWTLVLAGAVYVTWYLWWGIRRIRSLTTEPLLLQGPIERARQQTSTRSWTFWEITVAGRTFRYLDAYRFTARPREGTTVRIQYRRHTRKVLRIWAIAGPVPDESDPLTAAR